MKATIELTPEDLNEILRTWCKAKGIQPVQEVSFNIGMRYDRLPGMSAKPAFTGVTIEYVI